TEKALGNTTNITNQTEIDGATFPENAFIILNGVQVYPLDQSVINIGRRSDNHVVIEDPRVSRHHAQIRAVNGRYEIFDLDSTGGTFVNRQRVNQSVLRPGDVISLAGVPLIYGQEAPNSLGKTREFIPQEGLSEPHQTQ
ncbi:MAG: FHA domain-containing protein, partial [Anaerolineales bacterium]